MRNFVQAMGSTIRLENHRHLGTPGTRVIVRLQLATGSVA